MKMILASQRGSAMVEAAIFYPIIILAVMFAIYTCVNMYSMAALQADEHIRVRGAAGSAKGKVAAEIRWNQSVDRYRAAAEGKNISIVPGTRSGSRVMEASVEESYEGGRLIRGGRAKAAFHSASYVVDEVWAARLLDAALGD